MYKFEVLEQVYKSISSAEKAVAEFAQCAIYELDGGILVWIDTKKAILDNLLKQKALLKSIRDESSEITEEQRGIMQMWNLD